MTFSGGIVNMVVDWIVTLMGLHKWLFTGAYLC